MLWWWILVAIVIALLASAGFRKFALVMLLVFLALATTISVLNHYEDQVERGRIALDEVQLTDVSVRLIAGNYNIAGRINNNSSEFTLTRLGIDLLAQDCPPADGECVTIAEHTLEFLVEVPPGQARDFDRVTRLRDSQVNPKGRLQWRQGVRFTESD